MAAGLSCVVLGEERRCRKGKKWTTFDIDEEIVVLCCWWVCIGLFVAFGHEPSSSITEIMSSEQRLWRRMTWEWPFSSTDCFFSALKAQERTQSTSDSAKPHTTKIRSSTVMSS